MKIVFDLSNNELSSVINKFTSSAQELAAADQQNISLQKDLYKKEDDLREAKCQTRDYKASNEQLAKDVVYYRERIGMLENEISRLTRANYVTLTEIPKMEPTEMATLLRNVRAASEDPNFNFFMTMSRLAKSDEKIFMIKAIRESTGFGLIEAKQLVESMAFGDGHVTEKRVFEAIQKSA